MIWLVCLSLVCFAALWWAFYGYFIFLGIARLCHEPSKDLSELNEHPDVSILVCCRNEEQLVEQKVENLAALDYPKEKLEIIFLDGQSTDGTVQKLEELVSAYPQMRVVQTGRTGKIPQLNSVLPQLKSELVMNTDVDAQLERNVLLELLKEFAHGEHVGVVGAIVSPKNSCAEESQYWRSQNKVRVLESEVYSASQVTAPCYIFRRSLVDQFPEDVVADDIFITYQATVKGKKVVYCKSAQVHETRTPRNSREFFVHKLRKTNAYITEILRFLHYLPSMNLFWKIVYMSRTFQLLGAVWVLVAFLFLLMAFLSFKYYSLIVAYLVIAIISLGITHLIIGRVETGFIRKTGDFFISLKVFLMITALLLLAAVAYPFYRQDSRYTRLS